MPDIFSNRHDEFLKNFHQRMNTENNAFNRPKMIYAKHKNKYIFSCSMVIRVTQSNSFS